jgi:hypothetical protein
MLAKLHTLSPLGIDALPVEVEVDVSPGALPKTVLVGLPEQAVKESTHRIERAVVNSGFVRPQDLFATIRPSLPIRASVPAGRRLSCGCRACQTQNLRSRGDIPESPAMSLTDRPLS